MGAVQGFGLCVGQSADAGGHADAGAAAAATAEVDVGAGAQVLLRLLV